MKTMQIIFFTISTIILMLFSACNKESVTGVALNKNELCLISGVEETLIVSIFPENAYNKKVTWVSSNPNVATVNEQGLVTAMKDGATTITATTNDGMKTATCSVIVDYRHKWTGIWEFYTFDYLSYYSGGIIDSSSLVIIQDSITFAGTIQVYEKNKLKIIFKNNESEPIFNTFPIGINGLIYPIVDEVGKLSYYCGFEGNLTNNTVNISYYFNGPLGLAAHEYHTINGIKINMK